MKTPTVQWSADPDVVLLNGSEEFFKNLLETQARESFAEHEQIFLWAGVDSDHKIVDALYEGSFVATKKLIIVRDANKAEKSVLTEYCEDPNSDYVLVLSSSKGKKPAWWGKLKHDVKVDCAPLKPWEYKDWLVEYSTHHGFSLQEKYAESIHANVGDDLYALSNEMRKIFLHASGSSVAVKDITSVLVQHQTISPFKILEAWAMGKQDVAIRMASIFFHQATESHAHLPLISIFLGHIEKMLKCSSYRLLQLSDSEIQTRMGLTHYKLKPLLAQVANWKIRRLRRAYRELCEIDSMSKRGRNGELLFQWFLTQNFEESR